MNKGDKRGVSASDIETWFNAWDVEHDQAERMAAIRRAAAGLANTIRTHTPAGPDQSAAMRKLREVVWTANAAIAIEKGQHV